MLDPDGDRLGVWDVLTGGDQAFITGLDAALEKYKSRDIAWMDGSPDLQSDAVKDKLIVYAFVDDKDASKKVLSALSHPWVAKDHGRMQFVKLEGRDSELARGFNVTTVPTLVFYAPGLKEDDRLVERKGGDVHFRTIRTIQKKSFEQIRRALSK